MQLSKGCSAKRRHLTLWLAPDVCAYSKRLMFCVRSLRRQIPSLRALNPFCCQQVTQPEAQFSTMAAVAEPETKRAKTEYNHTREVGHASQIKQPTAPTCNRLLTALAQPGVAGASVHLWWMIRRTVYKRASPRSNVLAAVNRHFLMYMRP
jgi:hypothetical protein